MKRENGLLKKVTIGAGTVGAFLLGGGLLYSKMAVDHAVELPPAVDGQINFMPSDLTGRLGYYQDVRGSGRPLVLFHSINAAASAYEMRPLWELYQGKRPVYALDLPGFGISERSSTMRYSPALYAQAMIAFLQERVGEAADVIALSLGCEFAAKAALEAPELFNSLTCISPTGLGKTIDLSGETAYEVLSFPLWSQALFDLVASQASIRYFLNLNFVGDAPNDALDYAYATAHRPNAQFAPFYFLSGQLFSADIRPRVYERLTVPTLVLYDEDPNVGFDKLPVVLETNPHWQAEKIAPSRGLPHWERPVEVQTTLDKFWSSV